MAFTATISVPTQQPLTRISPKKHIEPAISESSLKFKKVMPEDMEFILPYLKLEKGRTTDFSYGGILMWVDYYNYEYCIYKNTLFIKGLSEDNRLVPSFSIPIGELPMNECMKLLQEYCEANKIKLQFSAVPEYGLKIFESFRPQYVEELRDYADYLYNAEKLVSLSGKKMAKKRNHVNRFLIENPNWELEILNVDNLNKALDFMNIYDLERDQNQYAENESNLSRKMIEEASKPGSEMTGAILISNGRTIGVTIGDVKHDTLFIHVEKADRDISGSYEFINKAFAEKMCKLFPEIKFINREDDCGDIGLRLAKESYHPDQMLKKFNIFF